MSYFRNFEFISKQKCSKLLTVSPLRNSKMNVDDACTHHRNYFPATGRKVQNLFFPKSSLKQFFRIILKYLYQKILLIVLLLYSKIN